MNNSEPEPQTWFCTLSAIMQKADRLAQMDNSKRRKNKRKGEDAEYLTQAWSKYNGNN